MSTALSSSRAHRSPPVPAGVVGLLGVDQPADQRGEEVEMVGVFDTEPGEMATRSLEHLHGGCVGLGARQGLGTNPGIVRWFISW